MRTNSVHGAVLGAALSGRCCGDVCDKLYASRFKLSVITPSDQTQAQMPAGRPICGRS